MCGKARTLVLQRVGTNVKLAAYSREIPSKTYPITDDPGQEERASEEFPRPEAQQRIQRKRSILMPDIIGAVQNPAQHVYAVGEDEAHRAKYPRQNVGEHQEADRKDGHQIVVLVDIPTGVRGEHIALADPIHGQQIDRQAVPLQQALWQAARHKVWAAVEQQHWIRVALSKGKRNQANGAYAQEQIVQDTACLADALLRLLGQFDVPSQRLREVEVRTVLDGPEDETGRHAAQIVNHIVGGLLPEAQHRRHGHHIFLALREDLLEHALLYEAQCKCLQFPVEMLSIRIEHHAGQKVVQLLEGEVIHVLVEGNLPGFRSRRLLSRLLGHEILEALKVKVKEAILAQDNSHGAGKLSNCKGSDCRTAITGDYPQEDGGTHKDVQRIQQDLELYEAKDLGHKYR